MKLEKYNPFDITANNAAVVGALGDNSCQWDAATSSVKCSNLQYPGAGAAAAADQLDALKTIAELQQAAAKMKEAAEATKNLQYAEEIIEPEWVKVESGSPLVGHDELMVDNTGLYTLMAIGLIMLIIMIVIAFRFWFL